MTTVPSIPNSPRILNATATPGQTTFAITWPVIADSELAAEDDLLVTVNGTPVTSANFTFAGNVITGLSGMWSGGTVTMAALVGGEAVRIRSARTPRRTGNFLEGKSLPMSELDKLMDDFAIQMRDTFDGTNQTVADFEAFVLGLTLPPPPSVTVKIVSLAASVSIGMTLQQADTLAAGSGYELAIDRDYTLPANVSLSAKQVRFSGGVITFGAFNLTFNSNAVIAGGAQIFNCNSTGKVLGTIAREVCFDWWGTTSASVADAATKTAINAALTYSVQSNNPFVRIFGTKPVYYLSAPVVKPDSIFGPELDFGGANVNYVTVGSSAGGAVQFLCSTSGANSRAKIKNAIFNGATTSWAIEIQGLCGVQISNCYFAQNAWGIVCHNKLSGTFTEYVRWRDCGFDVSCAQDWWFKRTSGTDSTHGCGPDGDVTVNAPTPAVGPCVLLDDTVVCYNAPFSAQFWIRDATYPVVKIGASNARFLVTGGAPTIENFSAGTITFAKTSSNAMVMCGAGPSEWSGSVNIGDCILMDQVSIGLDGVYRGRAKGFFVPGVTLPAGGGSISIGGTESNSYIVKAFLNGDQYFWSATIIVSKDPFGNTDAFVLRTHSSGGANFGSWGAPSLAWGGSTLTFTNASYPSGPGAIVASATVTDIGNGF